MNAPTPILYITLRADIGGGPKHVFELAEEIKKRNNYEVFIASPLQEPFGEQFIRISNKHFPMPFRKFSLLTLLNLIAFCFKNHIRIIHSHGRGAGIYSRILKLFGFRIIHTYHGIHQEPGLPGLVKIKIDRFLEKLTDILIFVSASECRKARSAGLGLLGNSRTIENGIKPITRTHVHQRGLILGNLSRLTYQKGQELLLENFHFLVTKYPDQDFKLYLGGDGEDQQKISQKISELQLEKKVFLKGAIKDPVSFLESIDIYVSQSRWEGLPLSVIEAMFLKLPCVLSNVIGHEEFITSGVALNGNDATLFSEAIHRLITKTEDYRRIAEGGFQFVHKKHTIQQQVDKTLKVYKELTNTTA